MKLKARGPIRFEDWEWGMEDVEPFGELYDQLLPKIIEAVEARVAEIISLQFTGSEDAYMRDDAAHGVDVKLGADGSFYIRLPIMIETPIEGQEGLVDVSDMEFTVPLIELVKEIPGHVDCGALIAVLIEATEHLTKRVNHGKARTEGESQA